LNWTPICVAELKHWRTKHRERCAPGWSGVWSRW
jgi:hypothetical protein